MFTHPLTYTKNKSFIVALGLLMALAFVLAVTVSTISAVFTSPINLTTNFAGTPVIDVDSSGVLHAAWEEEVSGARDIIYAQSTDDGVTFPAGSRINLSSTASLTSTNPQIKVDSVDNIHIAWEEDDSVSGEPEIYYATSTDGGVSFSAKKNISNDSLFSGSPYIEAGSGDEVHVVWTNETVGGDQLNQVFYSRSTDGGANFSSPVNISNTTHNVDQPTIRADANSATLFVIWQAEGPDLGIYRVISTDEGLNFGTALNIGGDTTTQINDSSIGIDGNGDIHVAAASFATSEPEIFYFRSTDSGVSFEAGVNLSSSAGDISAQPKLEALGESTVYVGWSENTCDADGCKKSILVRQSDDGGSAFAAATSPDGTQVLTSAGSIDFDVFGVNVYLIWEQAGVVQFMKGN